MDLQNEFLEGLQWFSVKLWVLFPLRSDLVGGGSFGRRAFPSPRGRRTLSSWMRDKATVLKVGVSALAISAGATIERRSSTRGPRGGQGPHRPRPTPSTPRPSPRTLSQHSPLWSCRGKVRGEARPCQHGNWGREGGGPRRGPMGGWVRHNGDGEECECGGSSEGGQWGLYTRQWAHSGGK